MTWSKRTSWIRYGLKDKDLTKFKVISLRAAQTSCVCNSVAKDQDFDVELSDHEKKGKPKSVPISRFGRIPKPYEDGSLRVMTTVRIPLSAFERLGVKLDNVDMLSLKFKGPDQGELYVDDVEFSR